MKITILGKEYDAPKLNFKEACELEELGFDFSKVDKRMFNSLRILLAYVMKTSVEQATEFIENNPSEFGAISEQLFNIVANSDFFKKMMATRK